MAAKIRRNDEVIILAGKDKGKKGKVTKVLTTGKVVVEGINLVKKTPKAGSGSRSTRWHR